MMNVPPGEADRLSMWQYEAMLWNWNEAHQVSDEVEAPDRDKTQRLIDKINASPALVH